MIKTSWCPDFPYFNKDGDLGCKFETIVEDAVVFKWAFTSSFCPTNAFDPIYEKSSCRACVDHSLDTCGPCCPSQKVFSCKWLRIRTDAMLRARTESTWMEMDINNQETRDENKPTYVLIMKQEKKNGEIKYPRELIQLFLKEHSTLQFEAPLAFK